jgi:CDP-diacylglycerol--serine O-phosphatidyltransferase
MSGLGTIGKVGVADILTMGNGVCGLLAIYFFMTQGKDITIGSALILLGFVFDGADGYAARRFGTKHDFGRHLDSISDAITFCIAPAFMVHVSFTGALDPFDDLAASSGAAFDAFVLGTSLSMVVLGLTRLYRFSMHGYRLIAFLGLATPAMAFLAIMVCHILNPQHSVNDHQVVPVTAVTILFIASLLMVASVSYPKVRGRTAIVFAVAVVAGLGLIGVLRYTEVEWTFTAYRAITLLALALVAGYILLGPVYMALIKREGDLSDGHDPP